MTRRESVAKNDLPVRTIADLIAYEARIGSTFCYGAFPTFVIAYTLLKDAYSSKRLWKGSPSATIFSSVAICAVGRDGYRHSG